MISFFLLWVWGPPSTTTKKRDFFFYGMQTNIYRFSSSKQPQIKKDFLQLQTFQH